MKNHLLIMSFSLSDFLLKGAEISMSDLFGIFLSFWKNTGYLRYDRSKNDS